MIQIAAARELACGARDLADARYRSRPDDVTIDALRMLATVIDELVDQLLVARRGG